MTQLPQHPIACTLTSDQIEAGRDGLLPGLVAKSKSTEQLAHGYRWHFESDEGLLSQVGAVLEAEHTCCQFLRFQLVVEPGQGPIVLEATGPEGTGAFLSSLLGSPPPTPPAPSSPPPHS